MLKRLLDFLDLTRPKSCDNKAKNHKMLLWFFGPCHRTGSTEIISRERNSMHGKAQLPGDAVPLWKAGISEMMGGVGKITS